MAALEAWLAQPGALQQIWRAVLWAFAAYLVLLGLAAFLTPDKVRSFLRAFASSAHVNVLEAALRALVGLALIAAAATTRDEGVARFVGVFLIVTAILMAILPGPHRRFAAVAVPPLLNRLNLFGSVTLILAAALIWFLD